MCRPSLAVIDRNIVLAINKRITHFPDKASSCGFQNWPVLLNNPMRLCHLHASDRGSWSHTETQTSYSVWGRLRLTFLNGMLPNSSCQWPNLSLKSFRCKLWHSEPLCPSHWFSKHQAPRHCGRSPCSVLLPTIFSPLFLVAIVEYKLYVIFKHP